MIRDMKGTHGGCRILIMEVSVYSNLIVTGSDSPMLLLWDFEFGSLVCTYSLE
jgi:hypothetical protein